MSYYGGRSRLARLALEKLENDNHLAELNHSSVNLQLFLYNFINLDFKLFYFLSNSKILVVPIWQSKSTRGLNKQQISWARRRRWDHWFFARKPREIRMVLHSIDPLGYALVAQILHVDHIRQWAAPTGLNVCLLNATISNAYRVQRN